MSLGRRRFMEIAGLGTAGILVGCKGRTADENKSAGAAETPKGAPATPPDAITLNLLFWGSALYAFNQAGDKLEVAYLTTDPGIPGCTFVAHKPMLEIAPGGGKIVAAQTTAQLGPNGELPAGLWQIPATSFAPSATTLSAPGLNDTPTPCNGEPAISSLKYVPRLQAGGTSTVSANWRDRFGIRLAFDKGTVQAQLPFNGGETAEWEVKGPGPTTGPYPFTDTLLLTVPLKAGAVTLESNGKQITIEPVAGSKKIDVRLLAQSVEDTGHVLQPGDQEPHFCVLYAAFNPIPAKPNRAELFFKDWCRKPAPTARGGVKKGPGPGKYCTGGLIRI